MQTGRRQVYARVHQTPGNNAIRPLPGSALPNVPHLVAVGGGGGAVRGPQQQDTLEYMSGNANQFINLTKEDAEVQKMLAEAEKHAAEAERARQQGRDELANAPLVRDLLSTVRQLQAARDAQDVEVDENRYLEQLQEHRPHLGSLVGYVAAFAAEDPHDLLSRVAKQHVAENYGDLMPLPAGATAHGWMWFVSDRFQAHALEAAATLKDRYARLVQVTFNTFIECADSRVQVKFARLVAALWRKSAVVSARRYSTTKAIDTLQQAIEMHVQSFRDVHFDGASLVVRGARPPGPLPRHRFL